MQVHSLGREDSWRREWNSTPAFLPEESHGQRSLAGYSPQGHKESDTTEATQYAKGFEEIKRYPIFWFGRINFVKMAILPKYSIKIFHHFKNSLFGEISLFRHIFLDLIYLKQTIDSLHLVSSISGPSQGKFVLISPYIGHIILFVL